MSDATLTMQETQSALDVGYARVLQLIKDGRLVRAAMYPTTIYAGSVERYRAERGNIRRPAAVDTLKPATARDVVQVLMLTGLFDTADIQRWERERLQKAVKKAQRPKPEKAPPPVKEPSERAVRVIEHWVRQDAARRA